MLCGWVMAVKANIYRPKVEPFCSLIVLLKNKVQVPK